MKKAIGMIFLVLLIVLLAAAFWAVYKLSNGFTSNITSFFLIADNKLINEDINGASIFDVPIKAHNLFGKSEIDYIIVRNEKADNFKFYVDGTEKRFCDEIDYTRAFDIYQDKNSIMIKQTDMEQILKKMYGAKTIEITGINKPKDFFTLIIMNKDKSIKLNFPVDCKDVVLPQSLLLNATHISF